MDNPKERTPWLQQAVPVASLLWNNDQVGKRFLSRLASFKWQIIGWDLGRFPACVRQAQSLRSFGMTNLFKFRRKRGEGHRAAPLPGSPLPLNNLYWIDCHPDRREGSSQTSYCFCTRKWLAFSNPYPVSRKAAYAPDMALVFNYLVLHFNDLHGWKNSIDWEFYEKSTNYLTFTLFSL